MDENGKLTDLRFAPTGFTLNEMDYSENVCKAALPSSSGGQQMPKSVVTVTPPPPVGVVDKTVVQPTIPQSQLNEINAMFAAVLSLGVPLDVATSFVNNMYNLDTGGFTQIYGVLPHADTWLSTSIRFDPTGFQSAPNF